jgi:RHS repeat-associated protein
MTYSYDGNYKRVNTYDSINDRTTIFVYDASGRLAAEYTINVPPPSVPVISYLTEDALGSVRVTTNSFTEVKARRDFLPFGEELYAGLAGRNASQKYSSSTDDTRKKFATYQRDAETGLDFAQSRYYSPMHGRFTSPDEFKGGPDELFDFEDDASDNPTLYADLSNPQSLNKYQYGYNNPYKYSDPEGHCPGHCPTCKKRSPAFVGPFAIPVVAGALAYILFNPTEVGKRTPQTKTDLAGDLLGLLPIPGSKYAGGLVGKILTKGGQEAVETGTKKVISGYTKHGLNQAIGRNGGRGVKAKEIVNATRKPRNVTARTDGTTKHTGKNATVITNSERKVITTYGKKRGPQIWNKGTKRRSGSGSAQRKANERGFSYNPKLIH